MASVGVVVVQRQYDLPHMVLALHACRRGTDILYGRQTYAAEQSHNTEHN
jgi:hypothetical protein